MKLESGKVSQQQMQISMSSPDLNDEDRQAVLDVLRTPHLSQGGRIPEFEKAFCDLTGARHAVAVSSGTAGLHLCIHAAGIGPGDLVITTPFSFVASSNVLLFENAIPIFVDVEKATGNMDPGLLKQAAHDLAEGGKKSERWLPRKGVGRNRNLKAFLPVDVFGQPADYDPILTVAREYDLKIIEDSCEALGSTYKNQSAGTFGDFGVFAFYPNKQITTGEGGVIITSEDEPAELMRALRNQGRATGDTWLQHTQLGYNYRLDEMSAALGVSQMRRLDELVDKRKRVADWYTQKLSGIPGVQPPYVAPNTTRMSWFVYVIQIDPGLDRNELGKRLEGRGVPVRPYFLPIHLQPYMMDRFGYQHGDFPLTEEMGAHGLALPYSGVMTETQVDYVCSILHQELIKNP